MNDAEVWARAERSALESIREADQEINSITTPPEYLDAGYELMLSKSIRQMSELVNPPVWWIECSFKERVLFSIRKSVGLILSLPVLIVAALLICIGLPFGIIGSRLLRVADWLSLDGQVMTERQEERLETKNQAGAGI